MNDPGRDSFVRLFERAREPEALAVFTDSQMARLLDQAGLPAPLHTSAVGELLVRRWLYRGEWPENLATKYEDCVPPRLKTAIQALGLHEVPGVDELSEAAAGSAWVFFVRRARRFLDAHGLIALLAGWGGSEAVLVPFRFLPNLPRDNRVRDLGGNSFPKWSSMVIAMEAEHGGDLGFIIDAVIPEGGDILEGASFGLPLLIARERATGALGPYPVLRVLATGEVRGSRVEPVQGTAAKATVAARMEAFFIAPGMEQPGGLNLPLGMTCKEAIKRIEVELVSRELVALTPRQAYDAIRATAQEVHAGVLKLGDAERRVNRCEEALQRSPASSFSHDGLLRVAVLRAAIANHEGNPSRSRCELEKARCSAATAQNPRLYAEAAAIEVVALTDLGFLSDAERIGRDLLTWVRDDMKGDASDRLWCEMVAAGALGGQPLLYGALRDLSRADESRRLLERALELAHELELAPEVCRGSTQLALWQAFIEPAEFDAAFAQAEETLARCAPADHRVSRAYLLRTRFLAAYRLLRSGAPPEDVTGWELPDRSIGHASWLYATVRKYRGALYAARGVMAEAKDDFTIAAALLSKADAPLLRFIGATAALQAAESLANWDRHSTAHFLAEALAMFRGFEDPPGPMLESAAWIRRSEALRTSGTGAFVPDPQHQFPY